MSKYAPHELGSRYGSAPPQQTHMDIERINAIGTTLADLTARTDALRGYL